MIVLKPAGFLFQSTQAGRPRHFCKPSRFRLTSRPSDDEEDGNDDMMIMMKMMMMMLLTIILAVMQSTLRR